MPGRPRLGVGLNAAYFSDGLFVDEYLGRVEGALDFHPTPAPDATRGASMICGAGAAACGAGAAALGAPVLTQPAAGARVVGPTITIKGGGLVTGAGVTIKDGTTPLIATPVACDASAATDESAAGLFPSTVSLGNGPHTLTAVQSLVPPGVDSPASAALAIEVVSATAPGTPGTPDVTVPAGGLVTASGSLSVSGTAAPGATVTITVLGEPRRSPSRRTR